MSYRRVVLGICLLACEATYGAPADPCLLIARPAIEAVTRARILTARVVDTDLERSCVITLLAGDGKGIVRLSLFRRAPPTLESGMSLQPLDKLLPVSGVGDEAVVNTNANEIKFRIGANWYHIRTHAAPCAGDTRDADDSVRSACAARRNELLTALAQAAVHEISALTAAP